MENKKSKSPISISDIMRKSFGNIATDKKSFDNRKSHDNINKQKTVAKPQHGRSISSINYGYMNDINIENYENQPIM